jgi:hypothetical protein
MMTSYPALRVDGTDEPRRVALVVNNILAGRLNVILELGIAAGATATTVRDDRLSEGVVPVPMLGTTVTDFDWLEPGLAVFTHGSGPSRIEPVLLFGGG